MNKMTRNKISLILFSLLAMAILGAVCMLYQKHKKPVHAFYQIKLNRPIPATSSAPFIYISDLYIESMLRTLILNNKQRIYTQEYIFYTITRGKTLQKERHYILKLQKNTGGNNAFKVLKSLKEKTTFTYSADNILQKDIVVNLESGTINVTTQDIHGSRLSLINEKLSNDLSVKIQTTDVNTGLDENFQVLIGTNGIGVSYNTDQEYNTQILQQLDADFAFQNLGIVVVGPFAFVNGYLQNNPITVELPSPMGTVQLENASFVSSDPNTISVGLNARFSSEKEGVITGICDINKMTNTVTGIRNLNYDHNVDPAVGIRLQQEIIMINNNMSQIVGKTMFAQLAGGNLDVTSGTLKLHYIISSDQRLQYLGNNIACKLNF